MLSGQFYLFRIKLKDGLIEDVYLVYSDGKWINNSRPNFYAKDLKEMSKLLKKEYPDARRIMGYLEVSDYSWEI